MKTRYYCMDCRYSFFRGFEPNQCPNCGDARLVVFENKSAEQLLREAQVLRG